MIRFTCPTCRNALSAPDGTQGRISACPKCRGRVVVPDYPSSFPAIPKVNLDATADESTAPSQAPSAPSPNVPGFGCTADEFPEWEYVAVTATAKNVKWPDRCAVCLVEQQTTMPVTFRRSADELKTFHIPHCKACFLKTATRKSPPAVIYDGWHSFTHSFRFWNHEYACLFRRANEDKLA